MFTYILDTNVVSDSTKSRPNEGTMKWLNNTDPDVCCLSILTIAELHRGVALLTSRNALAKAQRIGLWVEQVVGEYSNRLLDITPAVAYRWAYLPGRPTDFDSLIAATALTYDLTVVTRNVIEFEPFGVRLLNPFTP